MIQVADVGGMFLVSFAIALVSAALCEIWPASFAVRLRWSRSQKTTLGGVMGVWLCIAAYGYYRLAESRSTRQEGPVVAVVQPDVPWAPDVGDGYDPGQLFEKLVELSREAAQRAPAPELVVWPEASVVTPLNSEFCRAEPAQIQRTVDFMVHEQPAADAVRVRSWLEGKMKQGGDFAARIQALADETNASLIVGAPMRLPEANGVGGPWRSFNAAFFFRPHLPVVVQQKVHLFPAAERIPFVGTWAETPFRWLAAITGAQPEFELEPGAKFLPLAFGNSNGNHAFTLPICGEIDLARTAGVFLPHDQTRLLVNISDDGMFRRSAMLQVRQSMLAFRAVESRSAIARSANTGVSCFVRPTGEIQGAVTNAQGESWTGRGFPERAVIAEVLRLKASPSGTNAAEIAPLVAEIRKLRAAAGVEGYSVQRIDLDTRQTLYSRVEDAFAQCCTGAMLLALLARVGRGGRTGASEAA
jgi:apolipoprotein N-acyltransferase